MAIYHFSGTIISRNQGRSAIACAAYRAGEKLHDERYDKTYDYTKKQDVAHTEILLPEQAPEWMCDREKLWNFVEASEKRKDAQLAREFNFALPRELTIEQNIALAKAFVIQEFVSRGMVADLCVHNDKMPDGEMQPHAHVMLTLREVNSEGFGQKVREWNAKQNLLDWREAWGSVANQHLFLHEHDIKIDHRTLEAQGIDLEPQHKIGSAVAKERLARLADHQRIARENGEKLIADPKIALTAITHQQSTFTHQDLARFVNRHTADAEQFQEAYDKIMASRELVLLGQDAQKRDRFTTKEMLAIETKMVQLAEQLNSRNDHGVKEKLKLHAVNKRNLSSEQQMAFAHLVSDGSLKNVIGYAGSGKSYLLGAAREAWEHQGYQVHGVTLSGIAAENLEAGSGIVSRTIASRSYYWDKGEQHLTSKDILVVDEAGMIGSRQLARLLNEAERGKAKIVLVGDPYQLQAIEAGAAFRAVSDRTPTVSLTEIRRQKIDWQREATVELATGRTGEGVARYSAHDHVHNFESQAVAKQELVKFWNDVRINQPEKIQIMLTYTRADVRELNEIARQRRQAQNELGTDHTLITARGKRTFAERDRIYFLKNDRDLGVKNGTLGTIARLHGNMLTITLDKSEGQKTAKTITFSTDRYNELDHGYAATIHKSQGVTVDRTYVLASKYMDGHASYVGLSRHRESVDIFYSREEFIDEYALVQGLSRDRSKDVTLDYSDTAQTFAEQRGFEEAIQRQKQHEMPQPNQPENQRFELPVEKSQENEQKEQVQKTHESQSQENKNQKKQQNQRQEKQEEPSMFSEEQKIHYEKLLQEGMIRAKQAKLYDLPTIEREQGTKPRINFSDFKAQFEKENPEKAKALRDAIRPRSERVALEVEKQINLLANKALPTRLQNLENLEQLEKLEEYAAGIAKQPDVMSYLKRHNQVLSSKIQTLSQSRTKRQEQELDLDMDIDY